MRTDCWSSVLTGVVPKARLWRDAHVGPRDGCADRLGVGRIGLAALHMGLHMGWRHQPGIVAGHAQVPCPEIRAGTGLHADQTGAQIGEERQKLRPLDLPAQNNPPRLINRVLRHD